MEGVFEGIENKFSNEKIRQWKQILIKEKLKIIKETEFSNRKLLLMEKIF